MNLEMLAKSVKNSGVSFPNNGVRSDLVEVTPAVFISRAF